MCVFLSNEIVQWLVGRNRFLKGFGTARSVEV